ncbi:MAG TPA: TIGR02678 family protein [Acidimicrobiales bacterium]|nr:TIGR02678 family protein [Acidimicrobiales bacterium]
MGEPALAEHLAAERSRAIRHLLATPLVDVDADRDTFRLVARHQHSLTEWFESSCGWALVVDVAGGFARLSKRAAQVDASRPLRRNRGLKQPFDRRRYQLLCLVCAELVKHPVTTVGLLARALGGLDTSRHGERAAFVDALRALMAWGVLRTRGGEVDAFLESAQGNALLTADTARLHRMISSATAPSTLAEGLDVESATAALVAEPRYGEARHDPTSGDADQRMRWARHTLARRLLDDPVTYFDDLSPTERDYLATPSGRKWLRDRVAEAGFELEERAEGLLAVDPEGIATDRPFPAPSGNAHQLALLLLDRLAEPPGVLEPSAVRREVDAVLNRFPGWARSHREGDGPDRLADEAVDLLVGFGLALREPGGRVVARPALARYRLGKPTVSAPTLFEGDA